MPSPVIRSFHYDAAQRRLEVRFVSGRRYSYFDVPEETMERMRGSFSKGEFFNAHIRNRFRFERLPAEAEPEAISR
jgi:hypothetical protein